MTFDFFRACAPRATKSQPGSHQKHSLHSCRNLCSKLSRGLRAAVGSEAMLRKDGFANVFPPCSGHIGHADARISPVPVKPHTGIKIAQMIKLDTRVAMRPPGQPVSQMVLHGFIRAANNGRPIRLNASNCHCHRPPHHHRDGETFSNGDSDRYQQHCCR